MMKTHFRSIPVVLLTVFICFISSATGSEIKRVVFLPLALNGDATKDYLRQGLGDMFKSRLSDQGIVLVGDQSLEPLLTEEDKKGIGSQIRAEELGRTLDADYVVFGSITAIGSAYSLDLGIIDMHKDELRPRWISTTADEDQLIKRVEDAAETIKGEIEGIEVVDIPKKKAYSDDAHAKKNGKDGLLLRPSDEYYLLEPTGSHKVRMEVMASDAGDVDGDGIMELVILGRKKVMIYSKKGEYFALIDTLKPSFGDDFLKLSIGDADGDGRDEICIVSLNGRRAESSVWEWNGKLEKQYDIKGHLRIVGSPDSRAPKILFQESTGSKDGFFWGDLWLMSLDNKGRPVKDRALDLPNNPQFYTARFFDINRDGKEEILYLGSLNAAEYAYLYLCSPKGQVLWQSSETLGGTNNYIKIDFYDEHNVEPPRIPFNCSPVLMDSDGDGQMEVIAVKNIPRIGFLANAKTFIKSQVTVFKTKGTELIPAWNTGVNEYNVVDMFSKDGLLFLATHEPRMTNLNKESGKIMWFR